MMNRLRKLKGFTITELMIYIIISGVVVGTLLGMYFFVQRVYRKSSASYSIQRDTYSGVNWIKRDLMQSSLNSITVHPNGTGRSDIHPGFSCISAVEDGSLVLSDYGTPRWDKYVMYTLVPPKNPPADRSKPVLGKLVRWEAPIGYYQPVPGPTDIVPSGFKGGDSEIKTRVLLKNVLCPGSHGFRLIKRLELANRDVGGFRVAFVRKQYLPQEKRFVTQLSELNPTKVDDHEKWGRHFGIYPTQTLTKLVRVDLMVAETSTETGKSSLFHLNFKVAPRN